MDDYLPVLGTSFHEIYNSRCYCWSYGYLKASIRYKQLIKTEYSVGIVKVELAKSAAELMKVMTYSLVSTGHINEIEINNN